MIPVNKSDTGQKTVADTKKVSCCFIDSMSIQRGTESPVYDKTTIVTCYTDGTKKTVTKDNIMVLDTLQVFTVTLDPDPIFDEFIKKWTDNLKTLPVPASVDLLVYTTNSKYNKLNKRRKKIMLKKLKVRKFSNLVPSSVELATDYINEVGNVKLVTHFNIKESY